MLQIQPGKYTNNTFSAHHLSEICNQVGPVLLIQWLQLGIASTGCSEPAADTPAYNPCPNAESPTPYCCKRDLLDNINCNGGMFSASSVKEHNDNKMNPNRSIGPVTPAPNSYDEYAAKCKADDNNRPFCCRNSVSCFCLYYAISQCLWILISRCIGRSAHCLPLCPQAPVNASLYVQNQRLPTKA